MRLETSQIQCSIDAMLVESLREHIIYDEAGILAISKPAGLVSMGGAKGEFSIAAALPGLVNEEWPEKPRLAHRLDRFTSGVIVLARTKPFARNLQTAFKNRAIAKEYWALVDGVPDRDTGVVDCPVVANGMFMGVGEHGKAAQTAYETVQSNKEGVSFLRLRPQTGRRHQLRVHTACVLHQPILGDKDYHPFFHERTRLSVERDYAASRIAPEICARMTGQMLHAHSITFMHPGLGQEITLRAPLPPERASVWSDLGFDRLIAA